MIRAALYSLDTPMAMSRRGRLAARAAAAFYVVLVAVTFALAPRPLRGIPSTAVAHALTTSVVAGITAMLMYSQARASGRRGYLPLGGTFGYLSGVMLLFPLVFPGAVLNGDQVLGGRQSSPTLFYTWHLLFVGGIGASAWLLAHDQRTHRRPGVSTALARAIFWSSTAALLTALVVTVGHDSLPRIIDANGSLTPLAKALDVILLAAAAVVAMATLRWARHGSLINRWLATVAVLLLGDAIVNINTPSRYTEGWYFNRVFGLVAYTALLVYLIWALSRVDRANTALATNDTLTDTESRASLLATLQLELGRTERHGSPLAMLWIDLDGFKGVNDQLGHGVGDEVLRIVAARLTRQVRESDHVARLGGDEFGVLLCDDVSVDQLGPVASRMVLALAEPITVEDSTSLITASIGIAVAPDDATGPEDLLLRADLAMYAAKSLGGNRFHRFDAELGVEAIERAQLRHNLAAALRAHAFELDYQLIVDPVTRNAEGAEALVRWVDGQGRRVPAGQFIEFAESSGQITAIGHQVIDGLESDVPLVLEAMPPGFFMTLNLSVAELTDNALVARMVRGPLHNWAGQLYVEVTESLELHADSDADRHLSYLRECGYRIAIDDFGAGFSNFTRLERLNPALIKIDRSLVSRAGLAVEGGVAFLTAASSIATSLRCAVVAEGVETDGEAEVIRLLDIRYGQGFLYARPMPLRDLLRYHAPRAPYPGPRPEALDRRASDRGTSDHPGHDHPGHDLNGGAQSRPPSSSGSTD